MNKSNQTAENIISVIKSHINQGAHSGLGSVNLLAVGERAGIKNLGTVLRRKGISLMTVCRVVNALNELAPESAEKLKREISEAFAS